MAATKQKTQEKNGTPTAQEIDLEAAQQIINQAERQRLERFQIEYQRLCVEYGYELVARAQISDDGRIGTVMTIRKAERP